MSTGKYPFATAIAYGPDDKQATKLVIGVFKQPGRKDPAELRRWFSQTTDVRTDPSIAAEVLEFLREHGIKETVSAPGILGCPHEEGVDYPLGSTCPQCPFWANRDRLASASSATGQAEAPAFFPLPLVVAQLSSVRDTQPVNALGAADLHKAELTDVFLSALDRGLADPAQNFEKDGLLFNHATYLLAKWREQRAYPLFVRWLSLPGEGAFDLGGDIVTHSGARLLASVCGSDLEPIKGLIVNRGANEFCRGQAMYALGVLLAWGERERPEIEEYLRFLAREGLERTHGFVWNALASLCLDIEALPAFPELRRAFEEGLIDLSFMTLESLDEVERAPRGTVLARFSERYPRITDVIAETRWWSGYQHDSAVGGASQPGGDRIVGAPGETYVAPPKVGRNDLCPCGSGKKFKKCCGAK